MKKRTFFHGLLMAGMVVVALFMSSCKSDQEKLPIPEKAPFVMEIDMKSLALKSNFVSNRDEIADLMEKELNCPKEVADLIREDGQTGLDFEKPLYIFCDEDFKGVYGLAYIDDAEKFEDNLTSLANGIELEEDKKDDDLSWITSEGRREDEVVGVITKNYVLVGTIRGYHDADDQKKAFKKLLKGGGFYGTEAGKFMKEHSGDVTLTVNFGAISKKNLTRLFDSSYDEDYSKELVERLQKIQMVANLEFHTGQIELSAFIKGRNEEMDGAYKPISKDALAKLPEQDVVGVLAFGMEGKEFSKLLSKELKAMTEEMDSETSAIIATLINALKAMDGTAAAAVKLQDFQHPEFVGVLPIAEEKVEGIVNEYGYNRDLQKAGIRLSGDKKFTVLTNSKSYNYDEAKNMPKAALHAAGCLTYLFIDLQQIAKIALDNADLGDFDEAKNFEKSLRNIVGLLDYAEVRATELDESSLVIELTDESCNSLELLINKGIEFYGAVKKYDKAQREYYNSYDYYNSYNSYDDDDYGYDYDDDYYNYEVYDSIW